jgi:hypothetical protein
MAIQQRMKRPESLSGRSPSSATHEMRADESTQMCPCAMHRSDGKLEFAHCHGEEWNEVSAVGVNEPPLSGPRNSQSRPVFDVHRALA